MKLHFLGTGSSYPTTQRGVSATMLQHDGVVFVAVLTVLQCVSLLLGFTNRLLLNCTASGFTVHFAIEWADLPRHGFDGSVWLFDCGEGTQIQAQKVTVSRQKITNIFITHLHGDHVFGLPGLLCTISSQLGLTEEDLKKKRPLVEIFGPLGINKLINTVLTISHSPLAFQYRVHELVPVKEQYPEDWEDSQVDVATLTPHPSELPGTRITAITDSDGNMHWLLKDDEQWDVRAGWIHHRVPSFGFVIKEKDRTGTLDMKKLLTLGIKPGPVYGQLKGGNSITTEDGKTITPDMVVGPPYPGRTVVILGDTSDASPLAHLVQGCEVVVHEATFDNSLKDKALEFGHSTPLQAVAFAKSIGAKTLLLNHFSQRYVATSKDKSKNEESVTLLEEQAVAALGGSLVHVHCADDFFVYDIPSQPRNMATTQQC